MIYVTPQGRVFNQQMAQELALEDELVFLCGHYEGIDERVLETIVTDYVSIGDYVLTGGELPSMVMIDAVSRLVPGVLKMKSRRNLNPFIIIFWNIPSIHVRRFGRAKRCLIFFYQGIMQRWINGVCCSRRSVPGSADLICMRLMQGKAKPFPGCLRKNSPHGYD